MFIFCFIITNLLVTAFSRDFIYMCLASALFSGFYGCLIEIVEAQAFQLALTYFSLNTFSTKLHPNFEIDNA